MSSILDNLGNPSTSAFTLGADVQTSDLPKSLDYQTGAAYDVNSPAYDPTFGTGAGPSLADLQRGPPGITVTGVLQSVNSGAQEIAKTWGAFNAIQDNVANQKFQRQITQGQNDLYQKQALGALDLATKKADATLLIENARVAASVANDKAKMATSAPGSLSDSAMHNLTAAVSIAVLIYYGMKIAGK